MTGGGDAACCPACGAVGHSRLVNSATAGAADEWRCRADDCRVEIYVALAEGDR